jgi:flagellar protein FlgJ
MKIDGIDIPRTDSLEAQKLKQGAKHPDKETIAAKKVAREFESMFVGMMLKSMRDTVGKDMLAGKGQSEDIYRSMLDQEYAKSVSAQGGLGLAKTIEKQILSQGKPAKEAFAAVTEGERK